MKDDFDLLTLNVIDGSKFPPNKHEHQNDITTQQ